MKHTKKILAVLLAAGLAAGTAAGYILLADKPEQINISLLYKGASEGKNPDGTRFDAYYILSDEMIEKTSEQTGISEEELKDLLAVSYRGALDNTTTDVTVTCKSTELKDPKDILTTLANIYAEHMATAYRENSDTIFENTDVSHMDYLESADALELECVKLQGYLWRKINEEEDEYRKQRYINLNESVSNLINIRIRGMREITRKNGYSNNPKITMGIMEYRKGELERSLVKSGRQKNARNKAIDIYDATLFPTTSVPSIKGGEYYISTTRTGLDDIFTDSKYFIDEELTFENDLSEVTYIIEHLSEKKSTVMDHERDEISEEIANIKLDCISLYEYELSEQKGVIRWEFEEEK